MYDYVNNPYNRFAIEKASMPVGWCWYKLEAIENGVLITGIVPTAFFRSGPRKGAPNFKKSDKTTERKIFAPNEELKQFLEASGRGEGEAK